LRTPLHTIFFNQVGRDFHQPLPVRYVGRSTERSYFYTTSMPENECITTTLQKALRHNLDFRPTSIPAQGIRYILSEGFLTFAGIVPESSLWMICSFKLHDDSTGATAGKFSQQTY